MSSTILALPIQQQQDSNTNTIIIPHVQVIQVPLQNNYQQHQIYVDFSLRDVVPVCTQDNDVDFIDDDNQPMTTCPTISLNLDNVFKQRISTALISLGLQVIDHNIVIDDLMVRVEEHRSLLGQFSLRAEVDIQRVTLPGPNEGQMLNNNNSPGFKEDGCEWLEAEKGLVRVEEGEAMLLMAEKSNCAICLEKLLHGDCGSEEIEEELCDVVKLPNCPHVFHWDCICDWFVKSTTCPVCRATCLPVN